MAFSILNKYSYIKGKQEFNIYSASAIERHKGFIFVEAMHRQHVITALHGLEFLRLDTIELVPPLNVSKVF